MLIGLAVGAVVLVGLVAATLMGRGQTASTSPTPVPTLPPEPVNIIPLNERPFAHISPTEDGRNIILTVESLNKPAESAEYEIEYQAGTILQGFGGSLEIDPLPATVKQMLGSCSAGGKCSYDEDVKGGQLTLRFEGSDRYAVRGDWTFTKIDPKSDLISSRDGRFGLVGAGSKAKYGIVFQSPGLPAPAPAAALSNVYAVGVSGTVSNNLKVSIRLNEAATSARLAVWDGKAWSLLPGQVSDQVLNVPLKTLPLAVMAVAGE